MFTPTHTHGRKPLASEWYTVYAYYPWDLPRHTSSVTVWVKFNPVSVLKLIQYYFIFPSGVSFGLSHSPGL